MKNWQELLSLLKTEEQKKYFAVIFNEEIESVQREREIVGESMAVALWTIEI